MTDMTWFMWLSVLFCSLCWLILTTLVGCGSDARQKFDNLKKNIEEPQGPLRIVVVDDANLVKTLRRVWSARSEKELKVTEMTEAEFSKAKKWQADIVVYPPALIGELADKNRILPIPPERLENDSMGWVDVFPVIRVRECRWGKQAYATPFGSRTRVLVYRLDIFKKLKLQPPKTWREYARVAQQLDDKSRFADLVSGKEWKGAAEAWGKGQSANSLLIRSASYALHGGQYSTLFDINTMNPLVDEAPYARALAEASIAARFTTRQKSAIDCFKALLDGKCAMAITYPVGELNSLGYADDAKVPPLGVATLPGSVDVYNRQSKKWEKRLRQLLTDKLPTILSPWCCL